MSKTYNIAIIGAGATGLAAAYKLTQDGHAVTVLERNNEIGGLAASLKVQGARLERFYHHLFATDHAFINLVKEIGLGDKLYFKALPTGFYYHGQQYDFGTPLEILRLPVIPFGDRLRLAASSMYLKLLKDHRPLESINMLAWCRRYAGKKTTEVIWEPLLRSKFGKHADDVTLAWFWARVHYRTFKLGYVHGGFDQVYEVLADKIKREGGEILLNQYIKAIAQKSAEDPVVITMEDGSTKTYDRVICTTPQPVFAKMIGAPDHNDLWQARYLGATCFILELKKSLVPYYWLSINEAGFPFLAVIEQTRLTGTAEYNGRHIVYIGNYVARDDWRFTEDPKTLLKKYLPYLKKVNPDFKESDILDWHFSKAGFAQPIITPDYHNHIPPHQTALPGVWLATMSQVYPQDRGQNYAVKMGFEVAELAKQ